MRPPAHLATAIEILTAIGETDRAADRVVTQELRRRRYAGGRDRRAISDAVYAALRGQGLARWRLDLDEAPPPRLWAVLCWPDGAEAARRMMGAGGYGPEALNAAEAAALDRALARPDPPRWARLDIPPWLDPLLDESHGADVPALMAALNGRAPFDARVDRRVKTRDAALADLAAAGIVATAAPLSPVGVRLPAGLPTGSVPGIAEGWLVPQDAGSQAAALAVSARPGMRVLDLCAGGGGKTLALAAEMDDIGEIVACDIAPARLRQAETRAAAAGLTSVRFVELSSQAVPDGPYDRILIDAPCSGSGAWRRNPGARWRLTPDRLRDLTETQAALLDRAAGLIGPEGRMVYATCSVLALENDRAVDGFLRRRPDWRAVSRRQLLPHVDDTDGFFIAVLALAA